MLPITNKLLTVQIITTSTLITIALLSSCYSTTECLPITSKPIESTAENLAWEAWLMVPVGQQQKSRKVTPKSIFIVPQKRNQTIHCQPGEHLFESRCVPTVNIDTEKILLTQLTNLVIASEDEYDYDYDQEVIDASSAEKLEGEIDIIPPPVGDNVDEPLKFDIFRDNFPIGSSGSGDSSGNKDSEDDSVFFVGERHRRPPAPSETSLPDLDTGSTSYGAYNDSADGGSKDDSTLFLSGIDAILVPAVSETNGKEQNLNFSIYQEVVNTTTAKTDVEVFSPIAEKNVDLKEILKEESLFFDKDHELEKEIATTTAKIETTTDQFETESTTMKLEEDADVESKTEFTRSVTEDAPLEGETTVSSTELTDSTDITSTLSAEDDITTTVSPSDDTTIFTVDEEESSTIGISQDDITTISSSSEDITTSSDSELPTEPQSPSFNLADPPSPVNQSKPPSGDRFIYTRPRVEKSPTPVIDINAELKMINGLVARNRHSSTTTTPSVEASSSDRWSKIIPSSIVIPASTSPSSIESSTGTSNNIRSSSSSSSSNSIASSTDSQESITDTSSSTSPLPPTIVNSNPFWWLPSGWRVDRTDTDRPLLLRFWSALSGISGGQTKV